MTPMQLGVGLETEYFLFSCILGASLGMVYDALRAFRAVIRHNGFFVFVEDFVFTIFFGLSYFLFVTDLTLGIRGFVLVGMILGAVTERALLGNPVVKMIRGIMSFIKGKIIAPVVSLIAKISLRVGWSFGQKYTNLLKNKKKNENSLKVEKRLVYNIKE